MKRIITILITIFISINFYAMETVEITKKYVEEEKNKITTIEQWGKHFAQLPKDEQTGILQGVVITQGEFFNVMHLMKYDDEIFIQKLRKFRASPDEMEQLLSDEEIKKFPQENRLSVYTSFYSFSSLSNADHWRMKIESIINDKREQIAKEKKIDMDLCNEEKIINLTNEAMCQARGQIKQLAKKYADLTYQFISEAFLVSNLEVSKDGLAPYAFTDGLIKSWSDSEDTIEKNKFKGQQKGDCRII